jgi:hypothetical protein
MAGPGFGTPGHVALSVDRLFGYSHSSEQQSVGGMTQTTTSDNFTLLSNPHGAEVGAYTFPRLALDGFVGPGVSLGGALSFFHSSSSPQTSTGFVLAPRVGFVARLAPTVSLWPRGGITFITTSTDTKVGTMAITSASGNLLAFTIEAPLAFNLSRWAAVLVGPTIDVGLSGSNKTTPALGGATTTTDNKVTEFGLQAGLALVL